MLLTLKSVLLTCSKTRAGVRDCNHKTKCIFEMFINTDQICLVKPLHSGCIPESSGFSARVVTNVIWYVRSSMMACIISRWRNWPLDPWRCLEVRWCWGRLAGFLESWFLAWFSSFLLAVEHERRTDREIGAKRMFNRASVKYYAVSGTGKAYRAGVPDYIQPWAK